LVSGLVTIVKGQLAECVGQFSTLSCSPESWGPHAHNLVSHCQKLSWLLSHRWLFLDLQALEGPESAKALWEKAAVQRLLCLHLCPLLSPAVPCCPACLTTSRTPDTGLVFNLTFLSFLSGSVNLVGQTVPPHPDGGPVTPADTGLFTLCGLVLLSVVACLPLLLRDWRSGRTWF